VKIYVVFLRKGKKKTLVKFNFREIGDFTEFSCGTCWGNFWGGYLAEILPTISVKSYQDICKLPQIFVKKEKALSRSFSVLTFTM
jgi:hypothetical protein